MKPWILPALLMLLAACAGTQPPRVSCEGPLHPINPPLAAEPAPAKAQAPAPETRAGAEGAP